MDGAPRDVGSTLFDFLHMEMVHSFADMSEEKVYIGVPMIWSAQ